MDIEGFKDYREAGKIHAEALQYGLKLIKEGESLLSVTKKIEEKIISIGGSFAFPPQISLNETAAHYYPSDDDKTVFKNGDLAKLDIGIHKNGYIADGAVTVDVGGMNTELVKASRDALNAALKLCTPGTRIGEIGRAIQDAIESKGFVPVRNLSGHGLARFVIHCPPTVPNVFTPDDYELEEGLVIAIEPFASTGAGMVQERGEATLFMLEKKRNVRSTFTREVLKTIETFNGLPFAKRSLVQKHSAAKVGFALRELEQLGALHSFPPLVDRANGKVSQAEHTVIVADKPIITTKWDR